MPDDIVINPRLGGAYGNKLINHAVDQFSTTLRMVLRNAIQDGHLTGTIPPTREEERTFLEQQEPALRQLAAMGEPTAQQQLARLEEIRR